MTCIPFGSKDPESPRGFICVNDFHRLHVGNRYCWMEWHHFCGPSFYEDHGCTKPYYPDEDDPIWDAFQAWHDKRKAMIQAAEKGE